MRKAPLPPSAQLKIPGSAALREKTDFSLAPRIEQRAHPSQSQFEPVSAALKSTPSLALPSWHKDKRNIIDFNLWPSNQERTCEGEWFADEGDIKETKPG